MQQRVKHKNRKTEQRGITGELNWKSKIKMEIKPLLTVPHIKIATTQVTPKAIQELSCKDTQRTSK